MNEGGFNKSPTTFGQGTLQILLADLNKDGNLDLVLATFGGAWAYLGNGQGGFTDSAEFQGPLSGLVVPSIVMAADVNGDGVPDVGVMESDTLSIFLGNGDGTFQSHSASVPAHRLAMSWQKTCTGRRARRGCRISSHPIFPAA
jgi:hypothetical protein